jgi:hypothetical protein
LTTSGPILYHKGFGPEGLLAVMFGLITSFP